MSKITLLLSFFISSLALGVSDIQQVEAKIVNGMFGYRNYVQNPNCRKNAVYGIAASGGTVVKNTSSPLDGVSDCQWTPTAGSQTLKFSLDTFPSGISGANCEARINYKNIDALTQAYVEQNSIAITSSAVLPSVISSSGVSSINFPCGDTSTSTKVVIQTTSASAGVSKYSVYAGIATNLSDVSQATLVGSAVIPTTANCIPLNSSATLAAFSTDTDCPGPTIVTNAGPGVIQTTDTDLPQFTVNDLPAGTYEVTIIASAVQLLAGTAVILGAVSDGTDTRGAIGCEIAQATANGCPINTTGVFTYTSPGNRTFSFYGSVGGGGTIQLNNSSNQRQLTFIIKRFPTSLQLAVNSNIPVLPTIQTFTSGSGTYTPPYGVSWIRVRMVGGGGGGGGSGTTHPDGGAGGTTTFGSSLLTANGGSGSNGYAGGAGGTATISSPASGTSISGAFGNGVYANGGASQYPNGAPGGNSFFGGGGAGGAIAAAGGAGRTNSGAGGGGASGNNTGSELAGAGGGAGGYLEAIIKQPVPVSYAIGSAGTAGSSGGTAAGGAGGAGYIEVTENYQNQNVPLLVGSVTSATSGTEKIERTNLSVGSSTINSQSSSWISHVSSITGQSTYTMSGFSASPSCVCTTDTQSERPCFANVTSSTGLVVSRFSSGALSSGNVNIICMGSR